MFDSHQGWAYIWGTLKRKITCVLWGGKGLFSYNVLACFLFPVHSSHKNVFYVHRTQHIQRTPFLEIFNLRTSFLNHPYFAYSKIAASPNLCRKKWWLYSVNDREFQIFTNFVSSLPLNHLCDKYKIIRQHLQLAERGYGSGTTSKSCIAPMYIHTEIHLFHVLRY